MFSPTARRTLRSMEHLHDAWERHNEAAIAADGPLWIATGDSSQVGVCASSIETTSIMLGLAQLRARTGEPWRVVNLARHGAKFDAVRELQVSRLDEVAAQAGVERADLVTVGAGANDVFFDWGIDRLLGGVDRLLAVLPPDTVIGTMPLGLTGKGRRANTYLRAHAADFGIHVAEAGVLPRRRGLFAEDRMHPNDAGYQFIAEAMNAVTLRVIATKTAP